MYTLKGYRVKVHIKVYGNNNSEQMTLEYVSMDGIHDSILSIIFLKGYPANHKSVSHL